jgi:anti-sigma regulatory factor (Ser/Thr protein kinase)
MTPMTVEDANKTGKETLTLHSRIEDLALVPSWIESLASAHRLSESTQYAMNLCLEEVLSNIIRHGYANQPDRTIVVRYRAGQDSSSVLVVDDEAPQFNPLTTAPADIEETVHGDRIGGLGIHLLRCFASSLEYEPTPSGNRLSIGFSATS